MSSALGSGTSEARPPGEGGREGGVPVCTCVKNSTVSKPQKHTSGGDAPSRTGESINVSSFRTQEGYGTGGPGCFKDTTLSPASTERPFP